MSQIQPTDVVCVQPLSSPYALLPRAHTYALVLALLVPLPEGWLFRGALAAFTTRTATFAVDAFVLHARDIHGRGVVVRLDALGALEGLGLACLTAVWMLTVSRRVRASSARGLVRWWALLVSCGAVVGFTTARGMANLPKLQHGSDSGEPCGHGFVEVTAARLFGEEKHFSGGLGTMGSKMGYFVTRVGVPSIVFASLAFLSFLVPRDVFPSTSSGDVRYEGSCSGRGSWKLVQALITLSVPALCIFVAYSMEWYIYRLAGGLPSAEEIESVGQWGVWAATGVVVVGAALGSVLRKLGYMDGGEHQAHKLDKEKSDAEELIREV